MELLQLCGVRHADETEGASPEDGIDLRSYQALLNGALLAEDKHIGATTTKKTGELT
jgi:hypothetical protein